MYLVLLQSISVASALDLYRESFLRCCDCFRTKLNGPQTPALTGRWRRQVHVLDTCTAQPAAKITLWMCGYPVCQWEHCTAVTVATVRSHLWECLSLEVVFMEGTKTEEEGKGSKHARERWSAIGGALVVAPCVVVWYIHTYASSPGVFVVQGKWAL